MARPGRGLAEVLQFEMEDEDSKGDSSAEPVITFGEDMDVPAFIRNRQE